MKIDRDLLKRAQHAAKKFAVVSITGPRQSGKTTLSKEAFPHHQYLNLEDPTVLVKIKEDPKGFIENIDKGIIIDEVQKYPELLSFIQVSVDENYQPGKFIITGSQNLLLSDKINQSLAGRVAVLTLLPLTIAELKASKYFKKDLDTLILDGFYPGRFDKKIDRTLFYGSYLETYIERDVRSIKNIGDLTNFKRFLSVLAGRTGQLLNSSSIANDIGVTNKTINSWISVLEASYIVFRLPPYFKNYGKRVIKSPKIYFHDVGLASYLLELDSENELKNHFARGSLFENVIISDILKDKYNRNSSSHMYFWRDRAGHEIDLLISTGNKQVIVEIKSGRSYSTDFIKNLEFYKSILPKNEQPVGFVIYNGKEESHIKENKLINWKNLSKVQKES